MVAEFKYQFLKRRVFVLGKLNLNQCAQPDFEFKWEFKSKCVCFKSNSTCVTSSGRSTQQTWESSSYFSLLLAFSSHGIYCLFVFFSSSRKVNVLRAGTSLPHSWLEHCQHTPRAQYIYCLPDRGEEMCFLLSSSCQERVAET